MTHVYGVLATDFAVGQRVGIHPRCDIWMAGVRFGTVTGYCSDRYYVGVLCDDHRTHYFHPSYLRAVTPHATPPTPTTES